MNKLVPVFISVLFAAFAINSYAQSKDPVVFETDSIVLTQNLETAKYRLITPDETYEGLNFVKRLTQYYLQMLQVLDADNRVFYIDENGQIKDQIADPYQDGGWSLCDEFSVEETDSNLLIFMKDGDCFDDFDDEVPELFHQISKDDADSVLFINGRTELILDSNFYGRYEIIDPETLILVKDGKYFTEENPTLKFDSIDFSKYNNSLKTEKDGHYGILGIVEPKYKSIEAFDFFLAKARTENDEVVYIDYKGNEFSKRGVTLLKEYDVLRSGMEVAQEKQTPLKHIFDDTLKQSYWSLTELCLTDERLKKRVLEYLDTLNTNADKYERFWNFLEFQVMNDMEFIQSMDYKLGLGDMKWLLNRTLRENYAEMNIKLASYYYDEMDFMVDGVLEKFSEPLKERGLQLGFIDTESDSYTFVIHKIVDRDQVKKAVEEIGLWYWNVE